MKKQLAFSTALLLLLVGGFIYFRPAPNLLVTDGNSLTDGRYSAYPKDARHLLGRDWDLIDVGLSGCTTQHMLDVAPSTDALLHKHNRKRAVLVAWEITNDLILGAPRDDAYDRFMRYCRDRKKAGWFVVVLTVIPRGDKQPDTFEADRLAIDERMRREWPTFGDALVDVAADDRIGTFGRQLDQSLYYDRVHLTPKGYEFVAEDVAAAIRSR